MTDAALHVFLNPTAGRGRAKRRRKMIVALLERASKAVTVVESDAVGDLERRVQSAVASGVARVVVAGGDGSIHEAVNGIMAAGGKAALGVVPTGTGNDFAKACNIPLDWQQATRELALRLQRDQPLRRVDLGRMNGRWFANGAGVGFDARVTAAARAIRWPVGDVVYLLAILRCLKAGIASPDMAIHGAGRPWHGPVTLANVANGPWIGGMFHIAPMADNADGRFDLLIAAPVTRRRLLGLLPLLGAGRHVDEPEITHRQVEKVVLTTAAPVPAHLDGEVQPPASRFEITLAPGALTVL